MLSVEPRFAGSPVSPGENLDPEPDRDRPVASGRSPPLGGRARRPLQGEQDHGPPGAARAGPARTHPPRAGPRHLRAAAAARRRAASAHQLQRGDAPPGRPGLLRGPRAGHRPGVGRRRLDARHRRGRAGLPPAPPPPRRRRSDGRADGLHPGPARAAHRGHRVLALVALRRAQRPLQPRARPAPTRRTSRSRSAARTRRCCTSTRARR